MIDWNKYFEHIFILSRCSNFKQRELLEAELKRVGITNYTFWYNIDSNLIDTTHFVPEMSISQCRATYGHYSIIKICYELNYNNVLILEDDIRFLKDIDSIQNGLDEFLNSNSDFYLFDWITLDNVVNYYLLDAYYLNRRGMEYLIYCIENYPFHVDSYSYPTVLNNDNRDINRIFYVYGKPYNFYISKELNIQLNAANNRICVQNNPTVFNPNTNPNYNLYNIDKNI